jgi:hypothetical protein
VNAEEANQLPCKTCPCELCGALTILVDTKRCDRCWELERRIERDPALARKIMIRVLKDIDMANERKRDQIGPPDATPRTVGELRDLLVSFQDDMPLDPVAMRYMSQKGDERARWRFSSPFYWGKVDKSDPCRPNGGTLIRLQQVYDECAKQQVNCSIEYSDGSRTWQIMVTSAAPSEECRTKEYGDLNTAIDVILERLALPPGERQKVLG